jgi:hypothetical protein
MMTLRDFNGLSESGKKDVIDLWGDLITEKVIPSYYVKVYELNGFYVEVYYQPQKPEVKRYRACVRKATVCD